MNDPLHLRVDDFRCSCGWHAEAPQTWLWGGRLVQVHRRRSAWHMHMAEVASR
jgi:hypothetical protein